MEGVKIAFNLLGTGLGNNGGSRTIVKSAKVLRTLAGVSSVDIVCKVNHYTWEPVDTVCNDLSGYDAIISTGCNSVRYPLSSKVNGAKNLWWIRAHETWVDDEEGLLWLYKNCNAKLLVNSIWLKDLLLMKGNIHSELVYQGIETHFWYDINQRDHTSDKTVIGCLYSSKESKRWKDFLHLQKILGDKNFKYVAFGSELPNDKNSNLECFMLNPTPDALLFLYNSADIWFAPTILEGLHNVPMEASLCGCLIVGNKLRSNGMLDYANDDNSHRYNSLEEAADMCRHPDYSKVISLKNKIINDIGSRRKNMRQLLDIILNMEGCG